MSQNVLLAIYAIIGTIALYLTVQRVLGGAWMGALFSGGITAFCAYRLYTILDTPSSDSS
ncbi:MAG: hypothetical protein GVY35_00090 [Bacteroidetes bacterium]|jgi:hypothetical protein|nr:hypothetical protein [Bacteroidota bacterium]